VNGRTFQLGLKAGAAALAVWLATDDVVWAQPETNTNKLTVVKRKHRYSSRVQLLNEPAPAPLPTEPVEPEREKDGELKTLPDQSSTTRMPPMQVRRPRPKKEPGQGQLPIQPETQTNAAPELKNWGWLANEAEESRRYLRASKAAETNEPGPATARPGMTSTNGTNYVGMGGLMEYKPTLGSTAQTATVERVVEDETLRGVEKQRQEEARQAAAKKETLNMAEQQSLPPLFTATNETLGLARTRKDESAQDQDFQQTRAVMAEINSRYQLNYNLESTVRRPATSPSKTETTRADAGKMERRIGEERRPAGWGDGQAGASKVPAWTPTAVSPTLPERGTVSSLRLPAEGWGRTVAPASSTVEPPKPPKPFGSASPFSGTTPYKPGGVTPKSMFEGSTPAR
jgi:hypothetical protein